MHVMSCQCLFSYPQGQADGGKDERKMAKQDIKNVTKPQDLINKYDNSCFNKDRVKDKITNS